MRRPKDPTPKELYTLADQMEKLAVEADPRKVFTPAYILWLQAVGLYGEMAVVPGMLRREAKVARKIARYLEKKALKESK